MMLLTRAIAFLALCFLLMGLSWGMDVHLQQSAMQAYRDWFPETSINFQDGRYNDLLIPHLRRMKQNGLLRVIEILGTNQHRHFIVPLDMRLRYDEFGLQYAPNKNFFAGFRMPIDGSSASFEGIGEINGPSRKFAAHQFAYTIRTFTPLQHRIYLDIPEN